MATKKTTTKTKKKPSATVMKKIVGNANVMLNALTRRMDYQSKLGTQHDGDRDLYKTFGWKQDPKFDDYFAMYERNGLARRIVEIVSDETWRKDPIIADGEIKNNGPEEKLTPFLIGMNELVRRLDVYQHMRNVDINCGIGRWSLLYMGMRGDASSSASIATARKTRTNNDQVDPNRIMYLTTFDEGQAYKFGKVDTSISSARFGMPETYKVRVNGKDDLKNEKTIHHSRVLHVAENTRRSRAIGVPRLQAVMNILYDLEKITGASAEAFWMSVYQGFVFSVDDDYEVPDVNDAEYSDLQEQIEAFTHKLQRYIFAEGLKTVQPIKADVVSPLDQFKVGIQQASGATGIPQRILIGSERGELASDQDDKNFADAIDVRRSKFAETQLIRPFVKFCIDNKVVPPPQHGDFSIQHQSLFELNEVEKADVAYKVAQSIFVLTQNNPHASRMIPFEEFMKKYLGFAVDIPDVASLPVDDVDDEEDTSSSDVTEEDNTNE